MTAFLIGEAERASMASGQPSLVAAPGMAGLDALPFLVLRPVQGVLYRGGRAQGGAVPLPAGLRPLAVLAPDASTATALAERLPSGVPLLLDADPLPGLLALSVQALTESRAAQLALIGAPGSRPTALRTLVLDLPPAPQGAPLPARISQHLGRPAEGLAAIALHVAGSRASSASQLRVRLLAAGRVLAAWVVAGDEVPTGWLTLELPRPAPPGPAEALLEVAVEVAGSDILQLSAGATGGAAPLALRAEVAEPHHLVLPRYFDWSACHLPAPIPGLAMPVSAQAMAAATLTGASSRMVAAGGEAARLMVEIAAGASAQLHLPTLPPGTADLALAELSCRLGDATGLQACLQAGPEGGKPRDSGWRLAEGSGALRISMSLPPDLGGALALTLALRNRGTASMMVEVTTLALMAGAAGTPRRLAPEMGQPRRDGMQPIRLAVPLPGRMVSAAPEVTEAPELATALPTSSRMAEALSAPLTVGLPGPPPRATPTPPPLLVAEAGAPLPPPAPDAGTPMTPPAPLPMVVGEMAPGGAEFQDLRLHQHTTNADGSYRHIDLALTGLVAAAGVWREVRLKLFDRRGTIGLEFRRIKGWPAMFETWPQDGSDQYGPYYRLETLRTVESMAKLASAQDRAMLAALLELLPSLARRAARVAGLPLEEQESWAERGRVLIAAVDASRATPARATVGPG
ncbi:DUF6212 domain-containing protein [Roseomonas sp. F4]